MRCFNSFYRIFSRLQIVFMGLAGVFNLFIACTSDDNDEEKDSISLRTVLVYMAAENSLAENVDNDLQEMQEGAKDIPQNCRLIVYVDDNELPRLIEVKNDGKTQVLKKFGTDIDSADPSSFLNILREVKRMCPSDSYGLIMWSHGEGWLPSQSIRPAKTRWIGVDNNSNTDSNNGSKLDISDMASAIGKSLGTLDFIMFDACDMQTIEVAYELKDCCKYLIGSPALIPASGAPYHIIMKDMFLPVDNVSKIAEDYYNYYNTENITDGAFRYGVMLSVIDCAKLNDFARSFLGFISKHLTVYNEKAKEQEGHIVKYSFSYSDGISLQAMYYDMYSVILNFSDGYEQQEYLQMVDSIVKDYYTTEWISISPALITIDKSKVRGLSMYIPMYDRENNAQNMFQSTNWCKAIGLW